jgi:hydroxymethylbilane synthase|tara:strand:- start:637 stop:1551 length:915 start_codon:yes stop_codon:yes gene_type:complete
MNKKIIIGARGSKLSLSYAEIVKKLFFSASNQKKKIEIQTIKTSGDIFHDKKISDIGGKNIFCKEIENQLIEKKIDIAVHSLKDMDSFEENNLIIGAYLKRNDPRDVIVLKKDKSLSRDKLTIGSSSKRRELQFKSYFKNITCKNIRGNIDSRISKLKKGEYDGIILALAGIKMLNFENEIKEIFSEEKIIPAAGQGVIAAQCRKDDLENLKILEKINDENTKICALTERSLLKTIGGDCHTAVGVYAKIDKGNITISSQLFSDDGLKSFSIKKSGDKKFPQELGISAGKDLLKQSEGNYKKKR